MATFIVITGIANPPTGDAVATTRTTATLAGSSSTAPAVPTTGQIWPRGSKQGA